MSTNVPLEREASRRLAARRCEQGVMAPHNTQQESSTMSDTATQTETPETPEGLRKAKDEADRQLATERAENARLRKESLFTRAGIDFDKGVGQLLFNQWEGDKLDDLITKAVDLGVIDPEQPDHGDKPSPDQQQQQQMGEIFRGGPSGGGNSDPSKGPDPRMGLVETFHKAKLAGEADEIASMMALGEYFTKAQTDPRTRFDKGAHLAAGHAADTAMMGRQ